MLNDNSRLQAACLSLCQQTGKESLYNKIAEAFLGAKLPKNTINSITKMSLDSRKCDENSIFVAVLGSQNKGHDYIASAMANGCKLIFAQTQLAHENNKIELITINQAHALKLNVFDLANNLGDVAKAFYPLPITHHCIAVTGTNGKTSVASLCAQLYQHIGKSSATIGTLGVQACIDGQLTTIDNTLNTTPDILSIFANTHALAAKGIHNICLEASSHGLTQNRVSHLPIATAIFTNLSQDHLDYHQDMQSYAKAKRKLLDVSGLRRIVLNADDPESLIWAQNKPEKVDVYWYWVSQDKLSVDENNQYKGDKACWVSDIEYSNKGSQFLLHSSWGQRKVALPLIGHFNIANVLGAVCALLANGENFDAIAAAINNLQGVAGRMELFINTHAENKASILVDYAHTPDALKQALIAARAHTKGKLICVFGCGGDRDKTKRPLMGQIAMQYADSIYLTQDNSRSEPTRNIIKDIIAGIDDHNKVQIQSDRKLAIAQAWHYSNENDMILVAGKGHEDYMESKGQRIDYDERAYVKALLSGQAELSVVSALGERV